MLAVSSILFPTDFSESSRQAFAICIHLARATNASICVVHAVHDPEIANPGLRERIRNRRKQEANERLPEFAAVASEANVEVHTIVHAGRPPDEAILAEARERSADLIVVGAYGRRGRREDDIGPTARSVLRTAPCPVLTVRGHADAGERTLFRRVLIPTDFSKPARRALGFAADICALFESTAIILHVVEEFVPPAIYGLDINPIRTMSQKIEERARAEMRRISADFESKGISVRHQIATGHAPSEIVGFAENKDVDLIVIASRGGRLERFVIGSVADKVVLGSPCSVLTLKPA